MVMQCTSPFVARKSFWCIDETLRACGFVTEPYHAYVPSFGEWGFILASRVRSPAMATARPACAFSTRTTSPTLFQFPARHGAASPTEVNRLNNQALVRYFEAEWARYVQQ